MHGSPKENNDSLNIREPSIQKFAGFFIFYFLIYKSPRNDVGMCPQRIEYGDRSSDFVLMPTVRTALVKLDYVLAVGTAPMIVAVAWICDPHDKAEPQRYKDACADNSKNKTGHQTVLPNLTNLQNKFIITIFQ